MANESSFFLYKVECPICKTTNEFEVIKVGAYTEGGRDTDFCPQGIQWRHPRYQGFNPLVFFAAVCSNCHYTRELTQKFKDWKNDVNFRTYRLKAIKEKHIENLSAANSVVKDMGQAIDVANYPNRSAILKLHLAVFDELLADIPSMLDLGRFYLRIGWVYRSMEAGSDPKHSIAAGLVGELDNKFALLSSSIQSSGADIDRFSKHVDSQVESDDLSADLQSRMLPYRDRFVDHVQQLRGNYESLKAQLDDLKGTIDQYRGVMLGDTESGDSGKFGDHQSFRHFLQEIKRRWDGAVLSEHEALQKAVHYYCRAFESGHDISPGNQQIQVTYLIAELSRRIGDNDLARQYFNSTIKAGQEFIYQNRNDRSRTVLARKIMELAIEQGRANLVAAKPTR